MHAAVQHVFVLTTDKVQVIGSANGSASSQSWPVSGLLRVVGLDPQQTASPHLLLLGQDSGGAFLRSLDLSTGALTTELRLPPTVTGEVVDALLVRNQLDAHVLIGTVTNGRLMAHDLGTSVLGASPSVTAVGQLELADVQVPATAGITTASLIPGTTDQQVVVTYPDPQGSLHIAVLGWDKDQLALAATSAPDLTFARPDSPLFRVATGDLLGNGVDQIVVGYPATYAGTQGCAALLLLELSQHDKGPASLDLLSTYAAANTGNQPLASIDLHLAVGLFGETLPGDQSSPAEDAAAGVLGVIVIGGGATFSQVLNGEASILAGLVTVNPVEKAFPPLDKNAPGIPQELTAVMTIDYRSTGFFALASDVTGQSVILGPPVLSQAEGKGQLLALIQAPPYQDFGAAHFNRPTLTFGQGDNDMTGYNVTSSKTWMFSHDTGQTIGIKSQTLTNNVSNSYGNGFDNVDDNSTSTMVQISATIELEDLIVLYAMSYYVWTYPVYRKAKQGLPDGTMAVIFPMTPEPLQTFGPANDPSLGYVPRSQNGVLLSYVNLEPLGYKASNLLFKLISIPSTEDASGTTVTYDQTRMVTDNTTTTFMVHNSTSDSEHFSFSTELFDYIPLNFGLSITDGTSYSENDVQTTLLSHTISMSISLNSGSVDDIGHAYQIIPYIYQHDDMGCLIVTYEVTLTGVDWPSYYKLPSVLMQSLYPTSNDAILAAFSRSISFHENDDGNVTVSAEVFNNGLKEIQDVICEFYKGKPVLQSKLPVPTGDMIGSRKLETLPASGRAEMSMDMKLSEGDFVTVRVYVTDPDGNPLPPTIKVYWAVYPPSKFDQKRLPK